MDGAAPLVLPGGTPDNPCDPTVANELLACVISSFSYNSLINVLLLESVHYFAMYVNSVLSLLLTFYFYLL